MEEEEEEKEKKEEEEEAHRMLEQETWRRWEAVGDGGTHRMKRTTAAAEMGMDLLR